MKKLLAVILFISGTMALVLGALCLASYTSALNALKLADTHDVFQAVTLFGVCLIPLGVIQYIAGYWTWQNNWHGIILARFIGVLIFLDGLALYMILHRPDLAIPDMVKGIIISVLAFLQRKIR